MKFDEGWVKFFAQEIGKDYFSKTAGSIQVLRNEGTSIYPPEGMIFEAFKLTPFESVKVVIVGLDPYSEEGQADGLAFSVPTKVPIPPPLQNIYKELSNTFGIPVPKDGNLSGWASSGILLLNSVLTVEKGRPKAHKGRGWEELTDNCIKYISDNKDRVIFCLWGAEAQSKAILIDKKKHMILKTSHPGPLSVNQGFAGCGHFVHINEATKLWEK